jgi:signal transduction histidine kinase
MTPDDTRTTKRLYGRAERLALAAGALIMLGIVVASVVLAVRTENFLGDAAHAQRARALTVDLFQSVTTSESGQRGYLLTQRNDYLDAYSHASARVASLLDSLEQTIPGDPALPRWHAAIADKMHELGRTVELTGAGQHDAALAQVLTGRGKQDMDTIRDVFNDLAAREQDAITRGLDASRFGARLLVAFDVTAFLLMVLLVYFAISNLRTTMGQLRDSEEALLDANLKLEAGRDRLEVAVAERTAELTDANDEIQRFAYIVSHDLRAPLLNIIGFTSELEDATNRLNRFVSDNLEAAGIVVPEDVRAASREDLPEAIRFIQTSTAKMDRLITAILRLSREGRRVMTPERLDMAALLGGILDSMRHQADAGGAQVSLGNTPGLVSDRVAVEQVFSNLIENALKYTAAGRPGRINVYGRNEGRFVRYEVADNGRGIADRDRERVFELFRRAGAQNTTGEGIGLAHVRALLRRMGGSIDCESQVDVGSRFTVLLPARLPQAGGDLE